MIARTVALVLALATPLAAQHITTFREAFGASFGDDYFLANYKQISSYWRTLDREFDRMKVVAIGKTAEGREHLMAVVRSPENHRRLARYKDISARLAHAAALTDAQARALAKEGKVVVWLDGGLHATETVGAQQLGQTIAWFDSTTPLRSGWAWGQNYLENGVVAAEARVGNG